MRGGDEIAHDFLMAIRAFVHPDKLRARNTRRSHDRAIAIERATGKQSYREKVCSTAAPKQSKAVSVDPLGHFGFPPHLRIFYGEISRVNNKSCNKMVTPILGPFFKARLLRLAIGPISGTEKAIPVVGYFPPLKKRLKDWKMLRGASLIFCWIFSTRWPSRVGLPP
jgi:hypothetical protein